jgi:hypothetical protein
MTRRVTYNQVGDGSGEGDEAEEFNIWQRSKLTIMANSNGQSVMSGALENWVVRKMDLGQETLQA